MTRTEQGGAFEDAQAILRLLLQGTMAHAAMLDIDSWLGILKSTVAKLR